MSYGNLQRTLKLIYLFIVMVLQYISSNILQQYFFTEFNSFHMLLLLLFFWFVLLLNLRSIYIRFQKQTQLKIIEQANHIKNKLDPLQDLLDLMVEKKDKAKGKKIVFHQVPDALQEHLRKKLRTFEAEKGFKNPNILLDQLAKDAGTNSRYLSIVIRKEYDKSFTEYINELRVKEVLYMFGEGMHDKMTLEGLSQLAGFNSRVTFNRAFKKYTGKTPSVYLEEISFAS